MRNSSPRVAFLLTTILLFTGYVRGFEIWGGYTSSYVIPVLSVIGLAVLLRSASFSERIRLDTHWLLWLALVLWTLCSFLYNVMFRPEPMTALRLVTELSVSFGLLVLYAYLPDRRALERTYRAFVGISGVASLVLFLYPLTTGARTVRRIGGYDIPGAVNNIAQMVGVGIVVAFVGLVVADDWREKRLELLSLPALSAGLLVTGSRAAVIGVLLALSLLVLIDERARTKRVAALGVVSLLGIVSLLTLYQYVGGYRFGLDFLIRTMFKRFAIYATAIEQSGTTVLDLLFGGGMYRYSELAPAGVTHIIYPHNYVLSLLVHIGAPAALLFVAGTMVNLRGLFVLSLKRAGRLDYLVLCTGLSLVVVLLYAMTSGRLTRVFTVWIFLGISEWILGNSRGRTVPDDG